MPSEFDWSRIAWGRPDSPVSNLCSFCFAKIGEDDVPLRCWQRDGRAAVFCEACEPQVLAYMSVQRR